MNTKHIRDEYLENLIKRKDLAALLRVSTTTIDNLAAQGVLVRDEYGGDFFAKDKSVTGYVEFLRAQLKESGKSLADEKTRLAREQANKIELQNAQARREMVPATEVEREWSNILRQLRSNILALPNRVQQRLGHLTAHDVAIFDREIRDALAELGSDDEQDAI